MSQPKPTQSIVAIKADNESLEKSRLLADRLQLPLVTDDVQNSFQYFLQYSEGALAIVQAGPKAPGPVIVDFTAGVADHRRKRGGGELIVKAVGGSKKNRPTVVDATAGLGRDSFVLASWGYPVILCERSPLVAAVLEDGLVRAANHRDEELSEVIARMQLLAIDSCRYLQQDGRITPPDVIVIDPMFPASKKSALVKKDMRAFHQLVGADTDSNKLLATALETAIHRVVVKRPKKAEWLGGFKPNFSVEGKSIRFDIYSLKSFEK